MQALKNSIWFFCIACLCAEILRFLTGGAREQKSIKAIAGLYIISVTLRGISGMAKVAKPERELIPITEAETVQFGSFEEVLLEQTKERLEKELGKQVEEIAGYPLFPQIFLLQKGSEVAVERVTLSKLEDAEKRERIERLLRSLLGETEIVYRREE